MLEKPDPVRFKMRGVGAGGIRIIYCRKQFFFDSLNFLSIPELHVIKNKPVLVRVQSKKENSYNYYGMKDLL